MSDEIFIDPIGFVHSELKQRYETPRQGILTDELISIIKLKPHCNFEQALTAIEGFERIWIIYRFHLNENWKPMVTPPRHTREKVGVFATRAPYRPNQIGLSCVKLEKIEGLNIFISGSDILDGSPVIDIKPYLPFSDSFPNAKTGWTQTDFNERYKVSFTEEAETEAKNIKEEAGANVLSYARIQLEFNPSDITRKRISLYEDLPGKEKIFILAYQKWKIYFRVDDEKKAVSVIKIE